MTALMLLLPTTQANVSDWRGPDAVKPTQDGSEFTAFRVPTNATVLDSWVEISNDENAQSREDLLSWSVDDGLDQGILSGTSFSSRGEIILTDDFTVSIVEDFDDGNYTIEMPSGYYHSPGVLSVYNIQEFSSSQGCGNQSSVVISYGHDFDSDGNLDAQEISTSTEYCPSSGMDTSVTSLNITSIGSGYGDGNLSASGGGGSGFSGTYLSGRGIGSASLISGGSGYANGTVFNVACGRDCPGSGATVTATSVDSAGAITGIVLTSHGSNYTTDHVLTLDNTGSSGRQADISVTLNSTGHLAVAEIETLGTGYTSLPTIVLSGTGTGGVITPGLGGSFNWLANDNPNSADGAVCIEGGHIIDLGQDLDNDGVLDSTEITQNLTLCHNPDIDHWSSVLADTIGGTVYLDQRNLSHGVVPARAAEGKVMAATLPGSPVPAGTDTSLFLPLLTYHRVTSRLGITFRLSIGTTSTALPSEEETEPGWSTGFSMEVGGTGPSSNPPPDTPARCLLTARMSVANHQVRCQFSHLLPTVAGPQMRLISQQSPEYQSQTRSNLGSGCGHTHPPRTSGPVGI